MEDIEGCDNYLTETPDFPFRTTDFKHSNIA